MHAGTLVVRPLTDLGATQQIAKYDGSTVPLRSAMSALNIEVDRDRDAEKKAFKTCELVKILQFLYIQQHH